MCPKARDRDAIRRAPRAHAFAFATLCVSRPASFFHSVCSTFPSSSYVHGSGHNRVRAGMGRRSCMASDWAPRLPRRRVPAAFHARVIFANHNGSVHASRLRDAAQRRNLNSLPSLGHGGGWRSEPRWGRGRAATRWAAALPPAPSRWRAWLRGERKGGALMRDDGCAPRARPQGKPLAACRARGVHATPASRVRSD